MNFQKLHLLKIGPFKQVMLSLFPNEKARIIAKELSNYCFFANGKMYVVKPNITYETIDCERDQSNYLFTLVSSFLEQSYGSLSSEDVNHIKDDHSKDYKSMFSNSKIKLILPQLLTLMIRKNVIFDLTIGEIHYNNGYYDLRKMVFKNRDPTKHFVTKYIERDYKKSTQEQRKQIMEIMKKVYPKLADFKCILANFGAALSGEATKNAVALFLLGKGSAGKSIIMKLSAATIGCYFQELPHDTFSTVGSSSSDKIFNTFADGSQIRIIWLNEMDDKKVDGPKFKTFVEGEMTTKQLYKEKAHNIKHYGMMFTTANTMPNIQVDDGTTRRFKGYTHGSRFLKEEDKHLIDEDNHVYLGNLNLIDDIIRMGLLDAWFDILAEYCQKWYKGEKIEYTENFTETKNTVLGSNDIFQDFVDSSLIMTENPEDRIGKNEMHDRFKEVYPSKHLTVMQIINDLKDRKIEYNSQFRSNNVRGCFLCVRFRTGDDEDKTDVEKPVLNTMVSQKQYDELNAKFKELQKKYDALLKQKVKPVELILPVQNENEIEIEKLNIIQTMISELNKPKKVELKKPKKIVTINDDNYESDINEEDAKEQFSGKSFFNF